MTDLFVKVTTQLEQNLPFVLFCKPNSDKLVGMFQKNDHLYFTEHFEEKGFVFAPFEADTIPIIPIEFSTVMVDTVSQKTYKVSSKDFIIEDLVGNDFFEELVAKGVAEIKEGHFSKVVLSRKELVSINQFEIEKVLERMIYNYPAAFKYCFYHPKIGMWLGATPEQFIQTKGTAFKTVALAGTQMVTKPIADLQWGEKEQIEQQLVTDFIVDSLTDIVKDLTVTHPFTIQAGAIAHIKSEVSGNLKNQKALKSIIHTLHPTPAVCGLPKQEAMQFILKNEGYAREYYSGFLGELNINLASFKTQETDLFVNLRCMKMNLDTAILFVGCGITKDSDPHLEFKETVNKSMTMKKIIG